MDQISDTQKIGRARSAGLLADVLDSIHDHMNTRLGELRPWNWELVGKIKIEAA